MSKSLGNYVGINEAPAEMFGKLMSISDDLMWRYYLLLTDMTPAQIEELKQAVASGNAHPMEAKKSLARRLITDFHSAEAAARAQRDFEAQFRDKGLPSVVEQVSSPVAAKRKLFRLLVDLELFPSNSEAQRKIKEGAVYMAVGDSQQPDWKRLTDPTWDFDPREYPVVIFRIGTRPPVRVVFAQPNS
jgi:tyrosyl-tRNA synthetase